MRYYLKSTCSLHGCAVAVMAVTVNLLSTARAAEVTSNLGYGLEYTDNARLVPVNKEEEWTQTLNAGVSYLESSASLDARIQAQAAYQDYRNDLYSEDTVLGLSSSLQWRISPDRFTWTIEDYLTQSAIQSLAPDTPTNRQQTNVFTTGPDLKLRLSPVHTFQLSARYTRDTYETSDLDDARNSGNAAWLYQITLRTTLSLNYSVQEVNYDNVVINTDFDRQDGFLRIENRLASNTFVLDAGTTSIQRENVPDENGSLGRFSWTRLVSTVSTFVLSVSSELSDVGRQALIAGQTDTSIQQIAPSASITSDVFRTKNANITFMHRRSFGNDVVGFFRSKDEYKLSPAEEQRKGGNIDIGYEFAGTRTASVFGRYVETESNLAIPAVQFTDKSYGLRFSDRLIRNLTLGLDLGHNQRDNADPLQNYTERRAMLTLTYNSNSSGPSLFQ